MKEKLIYVALFILFYKFYQFRFRFFLILFTYLFI